jgi:hypothetical protein
MPYRLRLYVLSTTSLAHGHSAVVKCTVFMGQFDLFHREVEVAS